MRSRFLNTDYFFSAQSQFETLKSFNILSLSPPPPLSPPDPQLELDFPFSDLKSDLSSEVDRFPFASALSDFLADVVPQFIPHEIATEEENLGNIGSGAREQRLLESLHEEEFRSYSPEIRVPEGNERMKKLQFEIIEEFPLDTVEIDMGVTVTYPYEVVKSICSVEVIPDCLAMDDDSAAPKKTPKRTVIVPEFEVNEIGYGHERAPSIEEAFSALLPHIEPQHGVHSDELVINVKEFLESSNIDILDHFSMNASSETCLKDEPVCLNSVLEMNVIDLNGNMVLEENSTIYPMALAGDCSYMPCPVFFQEVQILDISSVHMFDQFSGSQATELPDISDEMFKYDIDSVGSFYEAMVSSELALVDDTFKSLPVPLFSDNKDMKLHSRIFENVLHVLKPHASTATDDLYLDWHPVTEGICTREICSTYICMLYEVSFSSMDSELQSSNEDVFYFNLDFIDGSPERLRIFERKEIITELHGIIPQANDAYVKAADSQVLKDGVSNNLNVKKLPTGNSEKVASLFESMSQSNDLDFFLGARRGTFRKSCSGEPLKEGSSKVTPPTASLKEPSQPSSLPDVHLEQWNIEVHHVSLSDHTLGLIDNIQKSYLAILNYGTDLRSNTLLAPEDDLKFIGLSKEKLLELITEKSRRQFTSGCTDETFTGLLALYAIKQLAFLLCLFGIHTAHLYISNLTQCSLIHKQFDKTDSLAIKLRPLESLIEDARQKSDRHLIESHSSLSLIEGILKFNTSQNSKILIIAERLFWLPLNQKLTSMKVKLHEVTQAYKFTNQLDTADFIRFTNHILEVLLHSDCLLISHENVTDSFPFDKFSIILEYGGSYISSTVSSITPKLHAPQIHFLKVRVENNNMHKAFWEGFDVPHHLAVEGASQSIPSLQGILNKEQIEELLSFVPIGKSSCFSSEAENHTDASHETNCSMSTSHSLNSKKINPNEPSSPDVVIVVNTQNFEKKMLISRRSSYQKILALEKDGVQVVEREINLPLDLIFSAAVCLVWYETRNLGDNMTSTQSIPMFMETIATNILMSLSFSFSGCILIFEGETCFLSAVMESSDALYAAAATLDLNLQLFCSYTPESTEEIILGCIGNASKLDRGIFPTMPESETIGESFLTKFPSINPLSAHAIINSGGMLIEFLEWSQKRRIQAIGKYHVPGESMHLFDALCRYGEMGESKSVMTECSSIDSDITSAKLQSGRKRQKSVVSSNNLYMPVDDFVHVEPLNPTKERMQELPRASQPYQLRDFFHLQDLKKTKSNQLFATDGVLPKMGVTDTSRINNSDIDGTVSYRHEKENFTPEVIDHSSTYLDGLGEVFAKKQAYNSRVSNPESYNTVGCGNPKGNFGSEFIDNNSNFLDENYPSILSSITLFGEPEPASEPEVLRNLHDSRLAFNHVLRRTFPTSKEIESDRDSWISVKDRAQILDGKKTRHKFSYSSKNDSPMKRQREYSRENPKCKRNALGLLSEEKSPLFVGKPHSKAIQSSRMQHGLQRTTEFLQSAKDKREVCQQTLTCNTCLTCPGSSRSTGKSYKKRSPSIIESFKYKGSSQAPESIRKWRKGGRVQDNSLSEEKKETDSIIPPTWTPVDKRARQNLSFRRSGNEKQSKLVWRNRYSPGSSFILRKRSRDVM
ncbi:uncharacterized protein A4U43_C04F8950 [Asparagus officinalis]|uniref:Protein SHORTAGE IN CHIASMATA 1 n=1 Tax=Asparagus officinalis TaxID=4686 RepID=A0A5P1EZD9_ASPOF|nr:uncharacterized protein A4U43_C04F8950 [Asparagus officinalis]